MFRTSFLLFLLLLVLLRILVLDVVGGVGVGIGLVFSISGWCFRSVVVGSGSGLVSLGLRYYNRILCDIRFIYMYFFYFFTLFYFI